MLDTIANDKVVTFGKKTPFFFSCFNFYRMKERGNTHYCFHCFASSGFRLNEKGEPINVAKDDILLIKNHDIDHVNAVIGNADKYNNPWDWLRGEIKPDFPYQIIVPKLF